MMADTLVLKVDAAELIADIERVEVGQLTLPTVSAVRILADGKVLASMPVYLGIVE